MMRGRAAPSPFWTGSGRQLAFNPTPAPSNPPTNRSFYKKVFEEVQRLCAGGPAALGPAAPPARHGVPSTPTRSLWGGAASSVTPSSAAAGAGLGLDSGSTSKALAGTGGARRELMLAETMPLGRQMRVLLVFLLLLGSLVHQLAMHHDLAQLRSHMQHLALP